MDDKENRLWSQSDVSHKRSIIKTYETLLVFLFCMAAPIFGSVTASTSDTLSLSDFLRQAGENYPLQSTDSLVRNELQLELENIRRSFYPLLNLNAQAAYYSDVVSIDLATSIPGLSFPQPHKDQYSVALELSQLIYDGGLTRSRTFLETEKTGLKKQNTAVRIYRFKQQLANVFFSALFLDDQYLMLQQNLRQLDRTISEARAAVNNGVLLEDDLNVLRAARLDIMQNKEANRHDHRAVIHILGIYLGTTLTDSVVLTVPSPVPVSGVINRPENKLYSLQRSVYDASIKLQQAMRRPKLYGFGQVGYGRPGLNPLNENFNGYYLFGAKLSWNIWDWKQNNRKKKILTLQQAEVNIEEETFLQDVSAKLINAREDINKLDTLILMDEERVRLRKQISETYAHKLSLGTVTSAEYEGQLTAYQQAQTQLDLHKIQRLEKQFNYMIINGNLTEYENKSHE